MKFPVPNPCELLLPPLRRLPSGLYSNGLALILNRVLARQLNDGELSFLHNCPLAIHVTDLTPVFLIVLRGGRFIPARAGEAEQVRISGDLHTFLLLASQREDADTLFFQRRLRMQGDTATGLHLKNFIDALDDSVLAPALRHMLDQFSGLYDRHCRDATVLNAAPGS